MHMGASSCPIRSCMVNLPCVLLLAICVPPKTIYEICGMNYRPVYQTGLYDELLKGILMKTHPGHESSPIYLDYNATTPVDPVVVEAMLPYLSTHFGNPSSSHSYGHAAHQAVDTARAQVARLLGCSPAEITFTGGGYGKDKLALPRGGLGPGTIGYHTFTHGAKHPALAPSRCPL